MNSTLVSTPKKIIGFEIFCTLSWFSALDKNYGLRSACDIGFFKLSGVQILWTGNPSKEAIIKWIFPQNIFSVVGPVSVVFSLKLLWGYLCIRKIEWLRKIEYFSF